MFYVLKVLVLKDKYLIIDTLQYFYLLFKVKRWIDVQVSTCFNMCRTNKHKCNNMYIGGNNRLQCQKSSDSFFGLFLDLTCVEGNPPPPFLLAANVKSLWS